MSFSAAAADERALGVAFSDDALSVSLRDGRVISVPLVWYPRLLNATPAQRNNWKIAGAGYGIHWPDLDEDLSTEGLLRGATEPRASAALVRQRNATKAHHLKPSDAERQAILNAISELNGDKLQAARLLGIGKTTLYRKLKEYAAQGKPRSAPSPARRHN
jgi:hypothetical protein